MKCDDKMTKLPIALFVSSSILRIHSLSSFILRVFLNHGSDSVLFAYSLAPPAPSPPLHFSNGREDIGMDMDREMDESKCEVAEEGEGVCVGADREAGQCSRGRR